jgi:hypothetical protein
MEKLSLLTYTHSKCEQLHYPYFKRLEKYFPDLKNNFVTSNKPVKQGNNILYNDTDPYSTHIINSLKLIPTDYILYCQEDYILFDYVLSNDLINLTNLMEGNQFISFIRLIDSGIEGNRVLFNPSLLYINPDSEYFFSTQATIWRRTELIKMFELSRAKSIFDEPYNSKFLKEIGAVGLCSLKRGNKVGSHYNSLIYPYIATAKVKGKWNFEEYNNELNCLFNEYDIKE